MLPSTKGMSNEEFRNYVRITAKMFAYRRYLAAHPGCDDEDAHAHVERHWREYLDTAFDFLATVEADREAREQAWLN